ncbi:hypothetical protein [Streptomyces sp. SM11]|nr:hypothetical protein [Streptomyces sp. SM11]
MVEQLKSTGPASSFTCDPLPAHVAAEARRIGCGPEKATLPKR